MNGRKIRVDNICGFFVRLPRLYVTPLLFKLSRIYSGIPNKKKWV